MRERECLSLCGSPGRRGRSRAGPILNAGHGLRRRQPVALAEGFLRPVLANLRHVQQEDEDVAGDAGLVVEVAADGVGLKQADQTGLLPRLLQGNFAGRLAGFRQPLGIAQRLPLRLLTTHTCPALRGMAAAW